MVTEVLYIDLTMDDLQIWSSLFHTIIWIFIGHLWTYGHHTWQWGLGGCGSAVGPLVSMEWKKFNFMGKKSILLLFFQEESVHICAFCGKLFHSLGGLQTHMNKHTGKFPFSCSICGKGYNSNLNLQSHMDSHLNQKVTPSLLSLLLPSLPALTSLPHAVFVARVITVILTCRVTWIHILIRR